MSNIPFGFAPKSHTRKGSFQLRRQDPEATDSCTASGPCSSRLQFITDWIQRGRESRYDAKALAKLCNVSSSQLRRYFSYSFLRPPQEWLDELRLWHATEILASGQPVKNVAYS